MRCYPDGLIMVDAGYFRRDDTVVDAVADLIEATTVPIELPPQSGILAFHWQHPAAQSRPEACPTLPPRSAEAAGAR